MPTLNIPPAVRFALYLIGSVGSLVMIYAIQKGWAGDPESQLWTGFAGLLTLLAASKTPVGDAPDDDEAGAVNWMAVAAVAAVGILIALVFGVHISVD